MPEQKEDKKKEDGNSWESVDSEEEKSDDQRGNATEKPKKKTPWVLNAV